MSATKKTNDTAVVTETTAIAAPQNAPYSIENYEGTHVFLPTLGCTLDVRTLTTEQVEHLVSIGWPHIRKIA
jgi:hypothetical protein